MMIFFQSISSNGILLWILGIISTLLAIRIQFQNDRIKTIENQLSDKKYKLYSEVVYLYMDIIYNVKKEVTLTDVQTTDKIFSIKREMFIYAPDNIFKKFTEWALSLNDSEKVSNSFKIYYELISMIRREMGHKGTKLSIDDFMLFIMQNEKEYAIFKKSMKW